MKFFELTLVLGLACLSLQGNLLGVSFEEYVEDPKKTLSTFGNVLLVRHAYAPGFGDPAHFKIEDCSTQRNLNREGIEQSRALGRAFRKAGFEFAGVYSSRWCRCLDTAKYMDAGEVVPFEGLNSFFQDLVPKKQTMETLQGFLENLEGDGVYLLVTHYVVIQELTGFAVASGAGVAYDTQTGQAVKVDFSDLK